MTARRKSGVAPGIGRALASRIGGPGSPGPQPPRRRVPRPKPCPDCGTELSYVKRVLWCWKCERYMRLGEQRRIEKEAHDA